VTATLLRAAALAAVYLLVLTSLKPGDIAMGMVLGLIVSVAVRSRLEASGRSLPPRGVAAVIFRTAGEMVIGSWRVARFCLGRRAAPGFVEIPRRDRTRMEVALWGVLTGEAPDEVVVDVDEVRGVLIVHLVDAADPDAVRERHRRTHDRLRRRGASDA
jgi:multisubunit Na+/H+ antiporter MnhE subunit